MAVRKGLAGLLIFAAAAGAPGSALAFNQRITVYATVAPMRYIYVDTAGQITKVAGNTADNITPKVLDQKNQPLTLTRGIEQQYERFLRQHGGKLAASKVYILKEANKTPKPDTQPGPALKFESY